MLPTQRRPPGLGLLFGLSGLDWMVAFGLASGLGICRPQPKKINRGATRCETVRKYGFRWRTINTCVVRMLLENRMGHTFSGSTAKMGE